MIHRTKTYLKVPCLTPSSPTALFIYLQVCLLGRLYLVFVLFRLRHAISFVVLLEISKPICSFVSDTKEKVQVDLKFTLPGKERQDSVYSGLQVHNSASLSIKA